MIQSVVVLLLTTWITLVTPDVRLPPQITVQPSESIIFQSAQPNVKVECEATGVPDVEYSWIKNGADFSLNRPNVEVVEGTGTFIFTTITTLDDGYYQCFAKNDYGVAKSKVANLQRAFLISYQPSDQVAQYTATVGDKLKVSCLQIKSYPVPKFNWVVSDSKDETGTQSAVVLSDRIQMDVDGNLYFSNTELSDQQDNKIYKCSAYNKDVELTSFGSHSQITVTPGSPGESRPIKEFSSLSPTIGLVGKSVDFKCLFSGYPTPSVSWSRATGGNMPAGRTQRTEYDTKLTISNLKKDDEGEYKCLGLNKVEQTDVIIELIVQEIPTFKEMTKRPNNINKTEGESVSFYCNAAGIPTPVVQWFRNGQPLDSNSPGPGMTITNGGTNLTVHDLCKDCNGKTDLAVFQCNSSNVHGYAYGEGYLNVLLETKMVAGPADVDMVDWEDEVFFECTATSDASTPVMIIWRFNDVQIDQSQPWYEVLPNGLKVIPTKMEDAESAEGTYTCVASNGMSGKESSAYLTIPEAPAPVVDAAGFPWWVIILIIVIVVILMIIICCICCCLWIQRNKGDEYPVDEKERAAGRNPEKENKDLGFHDYQRPEDTPFKGSRASLTSTIKLNDSDDEESLAEYGEPDTGKFNEDGSFLGEYKDKQRGRAANDSIV